MALADSEITHGEMQPDEGNMGRVAADDLVPVRVEDQCGRVAACTFDNEPTLCTRLHAADVNGRGTLVPT